ncbi:PEP/pyruvate-binding domain-containing protein [Oceanicoccus sp. KOV_DT_Chl]|uniref:PEP/pyruvate-binding domain-containing protein n=1 Tax=Oceanicoccus sp. KOV_DT_Chl TaxID=1904639 RepID=UPI001358B1B0|nr:PEP/pyruvate-binding domain-containing protein [Oceanicoccus sp. KOV_DT_Chl]
MSETSPAEPKIYQFNQIDNLDVGGKAYGLSRLQAMGLAVPAGFVICNAQTGCYPVDLDECYARIGAGKVAVRSSAQGEDGEDASFAGQYETVLDVFGPQALRQAIDQCVASISGARAAAYREDAGADTGSKVAMNVVVQQMVEARAAGVVFTADPVSARRDLLVIDAVAGLGEALVSGEATPDHYEVDRNGDIVERELVGTEAILSDHEINSLWREAKLAVAHEGQPLDLEWAIHQSGELFWLQARPITTLPADLNEFDVELPRPDDVVTISNVSEMMPGAVSPLTQSFTGWGIDYGCQHMQVTVGAREKIDRNWQITSAAYGHLLINLTGNTVMSAGIFGSDAARTGQTLCGRLVPELKDFPPMPFWKRCINMLRLFRYVMGAEKASRQYTEKMRHFQLEKRADSQSMWQEIAGKVSFYEYSMAVHLQTSALSGMLSSIVENMVSGKSNDSSAEEQGETVRLLAGAENVESAVMLEQLDALVDRIAEHPDAAASFQQANTEQALSWLRQTQPLSFQFAEFLQRHGHRGYRELCMRDPAWGDNPQPLIQSMQAAVAGRLLTGSGRAMQAEKIDYAALSRGLRWVLPKAHAAIRRREHTKSLLADSSHRFKRAFRHLGGLLAEEGKLPDADLVCFFSLEELAEVVPALCTADGKAYWVAKAQSRRDALPFQQRLQLPEVSVGLPQPVRQGPVDVKDGVMVGRPASRGVVEGVVRVAVNLEQAALLQAGEILITPITDIGWTPYFSLIAGLATDLGSSVSHGAVIAREYGLPCVVNTRQATQYFNTGDRVRLDGDTGSVTLLERA